jgi:hypothetical protein
VDHTAPHGYGAPELKTDVYNILVRDDVRYVNLDIVVETAPIPEVIDAIAQQNFMTVIWLRLNPVDSYEAARDGYYYGPEPVSHLSLQVETVWLRSWTAEHMPAATRSALGIMSTPLHSPEHDSY